MVLVALLRIAVDAEAFVWFIVVHKHRFALPAVVAFDAEVVISLRGQTALPVSTLQNSLGQCDRGRNARPLHFLHRPLGVGRDVGFAWGKYRLCAGGGFLGPNRIRTQQKHRTKEESKRSHGIKVAPF